MTENNYITFRTDNGAIWEDPDPTTGVVVNHVTTVDPSDVWRLVAEARGHDAIATIADNKGHAADRLRAWAESEDAVAEYLPASDFRATHEITVEDARGNRETIPVQIHGQHGPAFTVVEWEGDCDVDWERHSDGSWTFQGRAAPGNNDTVSVRRVR